MILFPLPWQCVGGKQLPKRKGRLVEVGASPKLLPAAENRPALRKSLPVAPGSKRKALYDRNAKQSNPTKLAGPVKAVNLHQLKPPAKDVEKTALKVHMDRVYYICAVRTYVAGYSHHDNL